MNEQKTIEQTREAKEQLRKSVAELISQFERDHTGILVDRINIDRTIGPTYYGKSYKSYKPFYVEIETILR